MQIEFGGRQFWDCSIGTSETFNPSDPWNYVASGQVCICALLHACLAGCAEEYRGARGGEPFH